MEIDNNTLQSVLRQSPMLIMSFILMVSLAREGQRRWSLALIKRERGPLKNETHNEDI